MHLKLSFFFFFFEIIQTIDILKAAGIDNHSGKLLKDRAELSAKTISEICNLSVTSRTFTNACKVAKLKPILSKGKKTDTDKLIVTNLDSELFIQLTYESQLLTDKILLLKLASAIFYFFTK